VITNLQTTVAIYNTHWEILWHCGNSK